MTEQENLILIENLHEIVNKHRTFIFGEPHLPEVYRILNSLYEKGILKKIFNISGKPFKFYFEVKHENIEGTIRIEDNGLTSYGFNIDISKEFRNLINQRYENYKKNS